MLCPHCGCDAKFKRWQKAGILTLNGPVTLRRAYYYCANCCSGFVPAKTTARQTEVVQELIVLAGMQNSFSLAAILLSKMTNLIVSESTVQRLTEETGHRLKQRQDNGETFTAEPWNWAADHEGERIGYVSLDATGVRMQGPQGEACEGKMVNVARLYSHANEGGTDRETPGNSMFLGSFDDSRELAKQLAAHAEALGGKAVKQWIAVIDGGAGIGDALRCAFPFLEEIRDFWHAKEYLVELANECFPEDSSRRQAWLDEICHRLKHHGGATVRRDLEHMTPDAAARPPLRDAHRKALTYFRNHEEQMDYPRYLARGWQIGSGPVESACKHVVKERLAGSGMRWRPHGAEGLVRLRALWNSGPAAWQALFTLSA